jgi:hypothetical protein
VAFPFTFPTTLPTWDLQEDEATEKYGLKAVLDGASVPSQLAGTMASLGAWAKQPVQLDRLYGPVQQETQMGTDKIVFGFLGGWAVGLGGCRFG